MDYRCAKFGDLFQPFWFYRADKHKHKEKESQTSLNVLLPQLASA